MVINEPELAASALKVVSKLWGTEFWITNTELYCLKFLKITPGFQCSIHAHSIKDETFIGCSGTLQLNIHRHDGGIHAVHNIQPGKQYRIRPAVFHSFQATNVAWVMEVSTLHSDEDVIRLQESRKFEAQSAGAEKVTE
jgi:D-lyxose ketol-isomerase